METRQRTGLFLNAIRAANAAARQRCDRSPALTTPSGPNAANFRS
jgi:hypothetical protein